MIDKVQHMGTLHPDGTVTPPGIEKWDIMMDGDGYVAFGPEENTTEMKYRVAVEMTSLEDASGEPGWLGMVQVVKNPHEINPKYLQRAYESCGIKDSDLMNTLIDVNLLRYDTIRSYGIQATVYQCVGWYGEHEKNWTENDQNFINEDEDDDEAYDWVKSRLEAKAAQVYGLLGFYLDQQMNALGNTGWDFIEGNIGFNNVKN